MRKFEKSLKVKFWVHRSSNNMWNVEINTIKTICQRIKNKFTYSKKTRKKSKSIPCANFKQKKCLTKVSWNLSNLNIFTLKIKKTFSLKGSYHTCNIFWIFFWCDLHHLADLIIFCSIFSHLVFRWSRGSNPRPKTMARIMSP